MAQGILRLGKPRSGKLGLYGLALFRLFGKACFQLLLVLQHDPVPVLNALGALIVFPARLEQHDQRGCGEHHRHQHQEKAQGGERQAGYLAAVHEQRDACEHEGHRQRHGKPDLHALLAPGAHALILLVLRFEHRLVGRLRSCVVVARQVDGVLHLRLLSGERLNAISQVAFLGGRDARQLFGVLALRKPMLAAQTLLLGAQFCDLLLQVGFVRLGLFQRFAVRLQRFDGGVQVADLRQQLIALRLHLGELVVLALQALHAIGFRGDAPAQVVLLGFKLHQGFLGCRRLRSELGQALLERRQRMRRGSPRAGTGREQLRRHIGGVAQLAQLIAGQAEHGSVRFAVDVFGNRRVALQAVGVADARGL